MKYKHNGQIVPQEKRKEVNEKLLYLIDNNLLEKYNIANQMIYNMYSGEGGLHGLNFKDFNSFYAFSEAKRDIEQGMFYTHHNMAKFIMDFLKPNETDFILDPTAGMGNFCNFAPVERNFFLNEIDLKSIKVARQLYPNANITNDDIKYFNPALKFDLIVGNPPFSIKMKIDKDEYLSEYYFCMKSAKLLKAGGLFCFICPKSFLENELERYQKEFLNENFNFIFQFELPKDAFKYVGVNNFETKVMLFRRKSEFIKDERVYSNEYIEVNELSEKESDRLYNTYVKELYNEKENIKAKLYFENKQDNKEEIEFQDKVIKLLYDIKRNPRCNNLYAKCQEYYNRYYNQEKPEGMEQSEWMKKRITKNKVISYLKKALQSQNDISRDEIKLVKTAYGLKLKGYSHKNKLYLSKFTGVKEKSFNDMIIEGVYPFQDNSYKKLFDRKLREYEIQNKSFKEIDEREDIGKWLKTHCLENKDTGEKIYLNDVQRKDINLALQKDSAYLGWETGSGKTLSSLIYALYRFGNKQIKNAFIIAPAIAVKNSYIELLELFNLPYILVKDIEDIKKINKGDFVLLTFNALAKKIYGKKRLYHFVTGYVKSINNKNTCLILDEADQISNISSQRSKSVISTFRKVKYKLLCSGTNIRNNLSEYKTALDLMYNNSVYMLSEASEIYTQDKETKAIKSIYNENYMKPIPPYKKGYLLYSQMYNPSKASILGISKYNQDMYNKEHLQKIIDKTLLIRTLFDVTGRDLYKIHQVPCVFNNEERNLYMKILDEFHEMIELHIKTGNSRKDSMFKILSQINGLLKACSIPQDFRQYEGGTPSKFKKAFELIDNVGEEKIAIGCTRIKTVNLYMSALKKRYPNKPIFSIIGNEVSLPQRKEIIKQFEGTRNGILISTMQSLSCSVSIPTVDNVICVERFYNFASQNQYIARFTRYTSENQTQIYDLFYEKSLEANLLKLVVNKEMLTNVMKNQDASYEELYDKFGIDSSVFNCLMEKVKDEDGHVRVTWNEQEIS